MIKSLFIFTLLVFVCSCSGFINQIEDNILNQKQDVYFGNKKKVFCKEAAKVELISANPYSQKFFHAYLNQFSEKYRFSFIDKSVLWSLYQFNLRPDINSPSSKLQIFIEDKGKDEYYHFFSKSPGAYPSLFGLEYLLKKYNSKYGLIDLVRIVDREFRNHYKVSKNFEDFLFENKNKLSLIPIFKEKYFRGDDTLRENENISPYRLFELVRRYQKTKSKINYQTSNKLFEYDKNKSFKSLCNYNMNMYSNSIYLIHKSFIKSHLYGIKEKNNFFFASNSQEMLDLKSLDNTSFFEGSSQSRSAAFCKFSFNSNQQTWMASTQSRDPGQHLYHLIEYGVEKVNSLEDLDQIMRFSRHLFLENPHRLIIESKRSSKDQLNRILKIDIPIYNSNQLGKVWGFYSSPKQKGFIIDDRGKGNIDCK